MNELDTVFARMRIIRRLGSPRRYWLLPWLWRALWLEHKVLKREADEVYAAYWTPTRRAAARDYARWFQSQMS